jgi:hypothetical protein
MDGREIESIVQYRLQNRFTSDAISGMNPRSITLRSGETFTYSIDLRRVYSMAPGKQYRVRCYFIPDFTRRNVLYSRNELSFALDERREKAFDRQAPVIAADITPSEIVLLTLEAEKKGHGERMLKYIDVEEYINTYSDFVRSYSQAGNLERQEILERFREYLTRPRGDYLIDYRVTGEELGGDVAYVDAYVDRHGIRKNDTYRYRYALKKTRNMWLITGLEATYSKGKPQ